APATAYWQVLLSSSLETTGQYTWWGGIAGNAGGVPVPADYDGDGKADLAVYLPAVSTPQALQAGHQDAPSSSSIGSPQAGSLLRPAAPDYGGQAGQAGLWQIFLSASGYQEVSRQFGGAEYQPAKE
ncbi:MAG: VCBS repeat-containing protein, partial [Lentisphaerae bacterium]|nr:VCBS repeat-containing protein [Lentisphaerota bacterium]